MCTRLLPSLLALLSMMALAVPATAGTVSGRISFDGKPPRERPIRMGKDDYCRDFYKGQRPPTPDRVHLGAEDGLASVFVYVLEEVEGSYDAPDVGAELDQKGCMYGPRVIGVMVGQKLVVHNNDRTEHNFHLLGRNKYNRSAGPGQTIDRTVRRTEDLRLRKGESRAIEKVKCDIHPWMAAYVGVMPHPFFAVSNDQGRFRIEGLPPGTYTLVAWHEMLGTLTQSVTVSDSQPATADFKFKR